jgi:hypothetical protein
VPPVRMAYRLGSAWAGGSGLGILMNTTEALRRLLGLIDELDTTVFEAQITEPLAIDLRRHLADMGHLVSDELAKVEQALIKEKT